MAHKGPDFIGIGMQKSGTTYVFEALRRAQGVSFPALPGEHEWLENPLVDGKRLNTLPKEIQFLSGPNAGWSWERYLEIFADRSADIVQGEISPAYAEASVERIKELRRHCPDVRLFAVLRDPVARDWSAIRMIAARVGELSDPVALRRIAMSDHVKSMGAYTGQLQAWLSVFSRENFLFLTNEALDQSPATAVHSLLAHIGAPTNAPLNLPPSRVFTGPTAELPPEIAELLRERHAHARAEVVALTGLDLSSWVPEAEDA